MASKVGFFCQWTIENFSYCVKEMVFSPVFSVTMLNGTSWNLCLQKQTVDGKSVIVCFLKRVIDKGPKNIKLYYEISTISSDHTIEPKYESRVEVDFQSKTCGEKIFIMTCQDYIKNFLSPPKKECLTICCRMWKSEITDIIKYFIRTPVRTHKRYLRWVLKDSFPLEDQRYEYLLKYSEKDTSPYKIQLNVRNGEIYDFMNIYLLQVKPTRRQLVKCKIYVLDIEGTVLFYKQKVHEFPSSGECWLLLGDDLELNFPLNSLCLLVELNISGTDVDGIEQITFGDGLDELSVPFKEQSKHSVASIDGMEKINFAEGFNELLASVKVTNHPTIHSFILTANSLTSKLLNFYKEGKLCDVVLKTDSSSLPVHKVILCAQSPVFTTMLETDLMEKQTGTIPIPNMSDDTVKKMIMFMYTDQVEGLDFEGAVNLYLASDQYDIVQLKRLCRDFLKSNLNISNITDALVVADLHQDEELKNASHDFVFQHDSELIVSYKWNQFIQDHLKLAAETLQCMYRRKLGK